MDDGGVAVAGLGIPGLEDAVEIGRGGFGRVYRCRQSSLSRTVAVKVLTDELTDETTRMRFERECWATGSLGGHPNIITVHGSGFTSERRPYIVMDFMPHGSLADRLEDGPLPWQEALSIGVQLAGALETAHRAGVLHRDIKPENVLVSKYGEPNLADFGIARMEGAPETRSGTLTASIAHVSPELLAGKPPSVEADVYALASTLYMLLTTQPAFLREEDESIVPALSRITSDPVPDLRPRGVPDALCAVIERAMAKDPDERYASAEAFGRALQEVQRELGESVTALPVRHTPGDNRQPAPPSSSPAPDPMATGTVAPPSLPPAGTGSVPASPSGPPPPSPAAPAAPASPSSAAPPHTGQPDAGQVPEAAEAPSPPKRSLVLPAAVVAVVLVGVLAVTWAVLRDPAEPEIAADGSNGEVVDGNGSVEAGAGLTSVDLVSARLRPDDLDGDWQVDPDLAGQLGGDPPPYLCSGTRLEGVVAQHEVAYRAGTPGPRVGQALRVFEPGAAAAFMEAMADEAACLTGLEAIEDLEVSRPTAGDEALLISYLRPGSQLDITIVLGFVRRGDVVGQVTHLGYPEIEQGITDRLVEVSDDRLSDLDDG